MKLYHVDVCLDNAFYLGFFATCGVLLALDLWDNGKEYFSEKPWTCVGLFLALLFGSTLAAGLAKAMVWLITGDRNE